VVTAPNLIEATQDCGAFVQLSGVLKRVAVKLSKICNDLRLLSSGPRAGLGEINLPPRAGRLVDHAGQGQSGDPRGGQPDRLRGDRQRRDRHLCRRGRTVAAQRLRAHHRPQPVQERAAPRPAAAPLADRCVAASPPTASTLRERSNRSIGIVTALNPYIGYAHATAVAAEAHASGRGVAEIVLERELMSGPSSLPLPPRCCARAKC
jgi:aspartate ammonia-lyase